MPATASHALPDASHAGVVRPSRGRAPARDDLRHIPWLEQLDAEARARALADLRVADVAPGELLCRVGRPVTYWFGLVDGLLKMSNDSAVGMPMTFTGVSPGGWFGEGTVLKREPYRYNIQALRASVVAGITVQTFHWLLDRSIGFNRFVMTQLNERLGQFIAAREIDRLNHPDARVARSLAALFHPLLYPGVGELLRITQQELGYLVGLSRQRVNEALFHPLLYPGVGELLRITQQELGYLVGLSRQRVNEALRALQAAGVIEVTYGGVRVLDLERLRRWGQED